MLVPLVSSVQQFSMLFSRPTGSLSLSYRDPHPNSVRVACVSDRPPTEELIKVLKGQDTLVIAFAGSNDDLQIRYTDAAVHAGVQRFVPTDFGSCDSSSPRALELIPLHGAKQKVRQHLQQLASASSMSWTSLVCGHFFGYGLKSGLLQYNLQTRKALIFDDGDVKWSSTMLETIALAVVRVLQRDEETENRMLYIQSVCVSQNEVLKSLKRLSGQNGQVEHISSEKYIRDIQARSVTNPNDAEEWENMISVVGIVNANWESNEGFANSLLLRSRFAHRRSRSSDQHLVPLTLGSWQRHLVSPHPHTLVHFATKTSAVSLPHVYHTLSRLCQTRSNGSRRWGTHLRGEL